MSRDKRHHQKAERIQENYTRIQQEYDWFINKMYELISKANEMPADERALFGMIDARPRSSSLDNKLNVLSSSCKVKQKKLFGIFPPIFPTQKRKVRAVFCSVSGKPDGINLEFKEKLSRKLSDTGAQKRIGKRVHHLYSIHAKDLNETLILEIIDWLTFTCNVSGCTYMRNKATRHKVFSS